MSETIQALKEAYRRLKALEDFTNKLADQLGQVDQLSKQLGDRGLGGPSGLIRVWLPTGIAAGTFGSPATASDGIIAVRASNGWTTSGGVTGQTIHNCDTTAVTGAKAGWCVLRSDNTLELVLADC